MGSYLHFNSTIYVPKYFYFNSYNLEKLDILENYKINLLKMLLSMIMVHRNLITFFNVKNVDFKKNMK